VTLVVPRPDPESTRHLLDEPLRKCLGTLLDSVAAYEAVRDRSGRIVDFMLAFTNEHAPGRNACEPSRNVCTGHFADVRTSGYFEQYCAVVESGIPLIEGALERGGRWWDMRVSRLGDGVLTVWRDITPRKRAEGELRRSTALLAAVIDASAAAIFVKDLGGRYILVNPVTERNLSRPGHPVVGRTDHDLLPPHVAERLREHDRAVLATGQTVTSEEVIEANGETRTFLTVKTPLRDERGAIYALCGVATDITSRIHTEEALRARVEELAVLMDATPAAVWIALDRDCRAIHGSREAHELLRMPPGANLSMTPGTEKPPSHFHVFANGKELAPEQLPMQRAARGEMLRNYEEEVVFENGDRMWLFGNAMPLKASDGSPRGAISVFLDITAQKRVEDDLRRARAAAEAANRARDEFLATVSHELRTPLNTVLGYVSMLQQGAVPAQRVPTVLSTIARNGRVQLRVVDDILDVARLRQGELTLDREVITIAPSLREAVDTVAPLAVGKRIAVAQAISDDTATIHGDRRRLYQILGNVLTNAVKFTPAAGRIEVSLHATVREVEILVADNGVGVAADFLPRIFEPFTQESMSPTREQGGLGLGLAIAHHLVVAHGGTINVISTGKGRGTTVHIRFPRAS
jgi:PAS domain S-box-containing protein